MDIKTSIGSKKSPLIDVDCVVCFKGIHKYNISYIIIWVMYYTWVISFATWWTASPLTENGFSTELRSLIHIIYLVSSGLFVFFISKKWFMKTVRIGALLAFVSVGLYLISPDIQILH